MAKELKNSKEIDPFQKHKEWHDKWSKNVMHIFGVTSWILVLSGIFGIGYLIHWIFKSFIL